MGGDGFLHSNRPPSTHRKMSLVDQLIHLPPCHYCVRQQLREKRGSEITQVQLLGAEEHREEISCDDDGSTLELDSEFSRYVQIPKSAFRSFP
jgi:hypothetical protein